MEKTNLEKKRFKEFETIRLMENHPAFGEQMRRALAICDDALGEGLYTEARLRALCRKENHYFYCVMKEKTMAGIFYCFAGRFGDTVLSAHIHAAFLSADAKVGVAQSIALMCEARGQGVSEWLLNSGTELLFEEEKAEAVLVPAWMKDGKVPARAHLERCGYRMLQVVERPWASYADLRCPVCGTVPCSCDGVIYIRRREV